MEWILANITSLLLIFCRISSFFVVAPIFSARGVPAQFKIGIAFFVALTIHSTLGGIDNVPLDALFYLLIVREILVGILLGFIAYAFFTAIQVSGAFIDMQMGFGIANVLDPLTGIQSPILGNFKFFIAMLLFLTMNGHHYLLLAIMDSYQWIPLDHDLFSHMLRGTVSEFILRTIAMMFVIAFQMAAPLIAALFLTDIALGMLARTVPQFNIFVIGIPVKIIVGFFIFILLISGFLALFQHLFETMFDAMRQFMHELNK